MTKPTVPPLQILVVEDDRAHGEIMAEVLEQDEHRVHIAASGQACSRTGRKQRKIKLGLPDLFIQHGAAIQMHIYIDPRMGPCKPGQDVWQETGSKIRWRAESHLSLDLRRNEQGHRFFIQHQNAPGISKQSFAFGS